MGLFNKIVDKVKKPKLQPIPEVAKIQEQRRIPENRIHGQQSKAPAPTTAVKIKDRTSREMNVEVAECSNIVRKLYQLEIDIWSSMPSKPDDSDEEEEEEFHEAIEEREMKQREADALFEEIDRRIRTWRGSNIAWKTNELLQIEVLVSEMAKERARKDAELRGEVIFFDEYEEDVSMVTQAMPTAPPGEHRIVRKATARSSSARIRDPVPEPPLRTPVVADERTPANIPINQSIIKPGLTEPTPEIDGTSLKELGQRSINGSVKGYTITAERYV